MNEIQSSTRRERQIAARREQIIQAAAGLFSSKGFHRTTTRDIAEAAEVSEGTLYNYFEDKDDLFFQCADTIFFEMYRHVWQEIKDEKNI